MPSDTSLVGWVLALLPLAGIAWHVAGTPGPVVLGVLVTALCHVGLLFWIARVAHVRLRSPVALFAFVWAAGVAAPAAAVANDLLHARLAIGGWALTVTGAPALEEAAKAGVLVALTGLWSTEARGVRAGIMIGALIGLGFGVAENVDYFLLARVQDGPAGLVRAIAMRGFLEGAVHPVFTASTGAGFGIARAPGRRRAPPAWLGFGAAVAQHALWNGVASPAVSGILCNGLEPSGACRGNPDLYRLVVAVPAIVAATLAPGIVTLAVLARRAGSRAGRAVSS